jgi:hypothetical protein
MPRTVLLAAILVTGCSTSATLMGPDGSTVLQGRLERSDGGGYYVRSADQQVHRVDRATVDDIDHPGNGAALAGMAWLAGSAFSVPLVGGEHWPIAAAYALPGAVLAGWGLYQWVRSVRAAEVAAPPEHALAGPLRRAPPSLYGASAAR